MRRLLSIVLLAFFGLGPAISVVPAPALGSGWMGKADESRLPACCRRGGKHHCALSETTGQAHGSSQETGVSPNDPCPFAPQTLATTAPTVAAALHTAADPERLASELCAPSPADAIAVLASRRSQPKRGPPAFQIL